MVADRLAVNIVRAIVKNPFQLLFIVRLFVVSDKYTFEYKIDAGITYNGFYSVLFLIFLIG